MKTGVKQYAQALLDLVDGKSETEVKAAIKNFVKYLGGKGELAKATKIIAEFEKKWKEKNGLLEAEIISAGDLDKEVIKNLNSYLIGKTGAKEVIIKTSKNKNILGGVIIRYEDKVLDGSMRGKIKNFKNSIIK